MKQTAPLKRESSSVQPLVARNGMTTRNRAKAAEMVNEVLLQYVRV